MAQNTIQCARFVTAIVFALGFGWGAHAAAAGPRFSAVMERAPEKIWAASLDPRVADSVRAFIQKKTLANGQIYGGSLRDFNLSKLCREQIEAWARKRGCEPEPDVVKSPPGTPNANRPLRDRQGRTIPLISYLCPDGGVIRMKPEGDPTNPRELLPSVVKAMRFFGSADYKTFSDEAFKVDNDGRPIPKWVKDLNTRLPGLSSERERGRYIQEWARDAHTRLRPCR